MEVCLYAQIKVNQLRSTFWDEKVQSLRLEGEIFLGDEFFYCEKMDFENFFTKIQFFLNF